MKKLKWLPFLVLAIVVMSSVLAESKGQFTYTGCALSSSFELLVHSFSNYRHIAAYGLLFLSCVWSFEKHSIIKAAALVLAFSILMEIVQISFHDGHCRIRDMLPNFVGVLWAATLYKLIELAFKRSKAKV